MVRRRPPAATPGATRPRTSCLATAPLRRLLRPAAALLATLLLAGAAHARSSLLLHYPPKMGEVPAGTFDLSGRQIGRSAFSFERLANGHYEMRVTMRVTDGGRHDTRAVFEPVQASEDGEPRLRPLLETSQSFQPDGRPRPLLTIDHVRGIASCAPPAAPNADAHGRETRSIPLPDEDRVANVPMNLLFLPIARGETKRIRFQLFVCAGGPKLHDFVALRSGPATEHGARRIVEVRYGPDLGRMVSWFASRLLPKLSFWFDANADGDYVAHRMPLYDKGPDILMVRNGVSPTEVGAPF